MPRLVSSYKIPEGNPSFGSDTYIKRINRELVNVHPNQLIDFKVEPREKGLVEINIAYESPPIFQPVSLIPPNNFVSQSSKLEYVYVVLSVDVDPNTLSVSSFLLNSSAVSSVDLIEPNVIQIKFSSVLADGDNLISNSSKFRSIYGQEIDFPAWIIRVRGGSVKTPDLIGDKFYGEDILSNHIVMERVPFHRDEDVATIVNKVNRKGGLLKYEVVRRDDLVARSNTAGWIYILRKTEELRVETFAPGNGASYDVANSTSYIYIKLSERLLDTSSFYNHVEISNTDGGTFTSLGSSKLSFIAEDLVRLTLDNAVTNNEYGYHVVRITPQLTDGTLIIGKDSGLPLKAPVYSSFESFSGQFTGGAGVTTANVTAAGALMDSECTDLAAVKATEDPFTAALLSKLNAIEANADVTDTANVTSAGALMDSECTDLAAVKATEDAFTAALKSKLDAIEASADVTDATNVASAGAVMDSELVNSSAGEDDAGKPIKLDNEGHIDATMINDGDIDHGSLGGLSDDDHSQYHNNSRGDARYYTETELDAGQLDNRYFTEAEHLTSSAGAGSAGAPIKLDAAGHIDVTMLNDADIDHGTIGGLGDDDHTIYLKVDGTRSMAGPLSMHDNRISNISNPTGDQDAVTKAFLEAFVPTVDQQSTTVEVFNGTIVAASPTVAGVTTATRFNQLNALVFSGNSTGNFKVGGDLSVTGNITVVTGNIVMTAGYTVDGVDISALDHGANLAGLGDDDHTQYHTDARGDDRYYTETELDAGQLDNRYFREDEFLNSADGEGSAGSPIKLDEGGHIDATMINDGDIDHGSVGGLSDDDHTQYHTDARGDARYRTETELASTSNGEGAAFIGLEDSAGKTSETTVEGAIAELHIKTPSLVWSQWIPWTASHVGRVTTSGTIADRSISVSSNSDLDGSTAITNMSGGQEESQYISFIVDADLDVTQVITLTAYYKLSGAPSEGEKVNVQWYLRAVADNEATTSGGQLVTGSTDKVITGYGGSDLVVHACGTVFTSSQTAVGDFVKGNIVVDDSGSDSDHTYGGTVQWIGVLITGTRAKVF